MSGIGPADEADQPNTTAVVVVHDGAGHVLAVSRGGNPVDIAMPGGHVHWGEAPADAARRELLEETGVRATVRPLFAAAAPDVDGRLVHVFEATWHDAAPPFTSEPGQSARWALPRELCAAGCTFASFAREHYAALFPEDHMPDTAPMAEITTKRRNALPGEAFADPANRAFPVQDAAHVRNAASRLEQQKGSMPAAKYRAIRAKIAAAARRFGIVSAYNKPKKKLGGGGLLRVRADLAAGGSFHVTHHMHDGAGHEWTAYAIRLGDEVPVAGYTLRAPTGEQPTRLVWIQLAEVGAFRGHAAGAFALTAGVFADCVKNFEKDGLPIPIDYEHASEAPATEGTVPVNGAPAQGWIHKLDNRGDAGLWGLVEWLPQAKAQITAGQYRYISPAIRFGGKDRVTGVEQGAKLTSAALTNQPFLKGMQPITAKDVALAYSPAEYMPRVRAALHLPELATAAECAAQVARLREHLASAGVGATTDGVELSDYLYPLRTIACGDRLSGTWHEVLETVEAMIHAAMERHEVEMHPGEEDDEEDDDEEDDEAMTELANAAAIDNTSNGETTMSEKNTPAANAPDPKDTEIAALTLQLKDATGATKAMRERIAMLEAETAKRADADLDDEAEAIIACHDAFDPGDKATIVRLLKADPEATRSKWPVNRASAPKPPPARLAYLTGRVIPMPRQGAAATVSAQPSMEETGVQVAVLEDGTEVDMRLLSERPAETAQRLMRDDQLSYMEASERAWELQKLARRASATR